MLAQVRSARTAMVHARDPRGAAARRAHRPPQAREHGLRRGRDARVRGRREVPLQARRPRRGGAHPFVEARRNDVWGRICTLSKMGST